MLDFFKKGVGEIPGMFSLSHFLFILIAFLVIFITLFLTRKDSNEKIFQRLKISSMIFLILEIFKIIWNLTLREDVSVNDYVPLYFCSFFIYANLGFCFIKNKNSIVYRFCVLFLFYGGISGGIGYLLYPTTALMVFPLLHILSFHSLVYHSFMVISSIWVLRFFKPNLKDFKLYGVALFIIEIIIIIINYICDTNFMLLNKSFGISILDIMYSIAPWLYPYIVAIGQALITFYPASCVYKFVLSRIIVEKNNNFDKNI